MTSKLSQLFLSFGLIVGLLFVLNGVIHIAFHAMGDEPILSDLRYVNLISFFLGLIFSGLIFSKLNKS